MQELSELLSHGQDGGLVGGADCVSHLPTTGLVADTAKAADAVVRSCAAVPAHALKRFGCCTGPEAAHAADIAHGKFRRGGASSVIVVDKGHDLVLRFFCWKNETFFVECSGGVQSCTTEIYWERRIVHYDRDRELPSAHAQYIRYCSCNFCMSVIPSQLQYKRLIWLRCPYLHMYCWSVAV